MRDRFIRGKRTSNIVTTHEQVTDRVEHFWANEFIFKTQAVFVQYAIIVSNDGTIEAAARGTGRGTAGIRYHA